jgi:hypothetical protein
MNKCKKCKKQILSKSIRCITCRNKYYNGKKHPCYKKGLPQCIDCGKLLSNYSCQRCKKCAGKQRRKAKRKCINCNIEINGYNSNRCRQCDSLRRKISYKGKNNPFYGKGYKFKGTNNPNWKGGKSFENYSYKFRHLREQIRKRDNYTCKLCNKKQKMEIKILNKKLSIHHIDYNKENNKFSNLITLCNQCNGKVNSNRLYWKNILKNNLWKKLQ